MYNLRVILDNIDIITHGLDELSSSSSHHDKKQQYKELSKSDLFTFHRQTYYLKTMNLNIAIAHDT